MKAVNEIVKEFLYSQDVNELSRNEYSVVVRQFIKWITTKGLSFWDLKKKDILAYKSDLINSKKSVHTIGLYLTVVHKLFGYLHENGFREENIALGVKSPKKDRMFRKKYLPVDKVKELLSVINTGTLQGKRDFAIISLMLRTGIRRVELCRMKVDDISPEIVSLQRKGKIDKEFKLGIKDKVLQVINDYLVCRDDLTGESPVFVAHKRGYSGKALSEQSVSRIVKHYLGKIAMTGKYYTCHSLRHTAAILALKNGASIYDVQQMLGHASIETTRIYLRAIDEEKRIDNVAIRTLDELF